MVIITKKQRLRRLRRLRVSKTHNGGGKVTIGKVGKVGNVTHVNPETGKVVTKKLSRWTHLKALPTALPMVITSLMKAKLNKYKYRTQSKAIGKEITALEKIKPFQPLSNKHMTVPQEEYDRHIKAQDEIEKTIDALKAQKLVANTESKKTFGTRFKEIYKEDYKKIRTDFKRGILSHAKDLVRTGVAIPFYGLHHIITEKGDVGSFLTGVDKFTNQALKLDKYKTRFMTRGRQTKKWFGKGVRKVTNVLTKKSRDIGYSLSLSKGKKSQKYEAVDLKVGRKLLDKRALAEAEFQESKDKVSILKRKGLLENSEKRELFNEEQKIELLKSKILNYNLKFKSLEENLFEPNKVRLRTLDATYGKTLTDLQEKITQQPLGAALISEKLNELSFTNAGKLTETYISDQLNKTFDSGIDTDALKNNIIEHLTKDKIKELQKFYTATTTPTNRNGTTDYDKLKEMRKTAKFLINITPGENKRKALEQSKKQLDAICDTYDKSEYVKQHIADYSKMSDEKTQIDYDALIFKTTLKKVKGHTELLQNNYKMIYFRGEHQTPDDIKQKLKDVKNERATLKQYIQEKKGELSKQDQLKLKILAHVNPAALLAQINSATPMSVHKILSKNLNEYKTRTPSDKVAQFSANALMRKKHAVNSATYLKAQKQVVNKARQQLLRLNKRVLSNPDDKFYKDWHAEATAALEQANKQLEQAQKYAQNAETFSQWAEVNLAKARAAATPEAIAAAKKAADNAAAAAPAEGKAAAEAAAIIAARTAIASRYIEENKASGYPTKHKYNETFNSNGALLTQKPSGKYRYIKKKVNTEELLRQERKAAAAKLAAVPTTGAVAAPPTAANAKTATNAKVPVPASTAAKKALDNAAAEKVAAAAAKKAPAAATTAVTAAETAATTANAKAAPAPAPSPSPAPAAPAPAAPAAKAPSTTTTKPVTPSPVTAAAAAAKKTAAAAKKASAPAPSTTATKPVTASPTAAAAAAKKAADNAAAKTAADNAAAKKATDNAAAKKAAPAPTTAAPGDTAAAAATTTAAAAKAQQLPPTAAPAAPVTTTVTAEADYWTKRQKIAAKKNVKNTENATKKTAPPRGSLYKRPPPNIPIKETSFPSVPTRSFPPILANPKSPASISLLNRLLRRKSKTTTQPHVAYTHGRGVEQFLG